jgi:hypothetical protein
VEVSGYIQHQEAPKAQLEAARMASDVLLPVWAVRSSRRTSHIGDTVPNRRQTDQAPLRNLHLGMNHHKVGGLGR